MSIKEIKGIVDTDGNIIVPQGMLKYLGFRLGSKITLLHFGADELLTICRDDDTDNSSNVGELSIPKRMVDAANIPIGYDLKVTCVDGAIVITESDMDDGIPSDVYELCGELGISRSKVRIALAKELERMNAQ